MAFSSCPGAIGVFDSGYGGLTILHGVRRALPDYDYLYLGDNARAPYGTRSFDVVYRFTREAVEMLFLMGCHLVVLACNTASAKALRTIQQVDLPRWDPARRVLGIIRPTAERVGSLTKTRHVGILATEGTARSRSYELEIAKLHPGVAVTVEACPMWVPLVENNESSSPGADYFVRKGLDGLMERDPLIDSIILGCTHYPLLLDKISRYAPPGVRIIEQGGYVADSLGDYLARHPGMAARCTRGGTCRYLTTERPDRFRASASIFLRESVDAECVTLGP